MVDYCADFTGNETPLIGTDVLLQVWDGSAYKTICGQRGCTLNLKLDTIALKWKCSNRWTNRIPGDRDWSVDFDGMHMLTAPGESDTETTVKLLRSAIMNDTAADSEVQLKLVFPGSHYATGYGYMESMTFDDPVGAEATVKGTFVANGAITFA